MSHHPQRNRNLPQASKLGILHLPSRLRSSKKCHLPRNLPQASKLGILHLPSRLRSSKKCHLPRKRACCRFFRWEELLTEQQERYYHEVATGRSQWDLPSEGWVALLDDDGAKPQGARHWEGGTARFDTQDALGGDDMTCEDGAWRCEVEHVFASTLDDQSSEQVERVEGLLEAKVERQSCLELLQSIGGSLEEAEAFMEEYGESQISVKDFLDLFFEPEAVPDSDGEEVIEKSEWMQKANENGLALQFASKELQNDKEVMLAAVQQKGLALAFASEELQSDKDIVLAAARQDCNAVLFASEELQNDKDVVLTAVQQNGYALRFAPLKLKNDEDIVLAAVQQRGLALKFASEDLKQNKAAVLAAVQQAGFAVQFASRELQNNKEVMLAAVQQNGCALQFGYDLKKDKHVVLAAVLQDGHAWHFASEELRQDRDILQATSIE
ncbi:unnamed protein product [Durusdinium trenchii]|uniref:WW domain-containing protein n=1 Tax=Durusdinium trenchii TaxID=1381693 RepID=A0ABP0SSL8_9DINO